MWWLPSFEILIPILLYAGAVSMAQQFTIDHHNRNYLSQTDHIETIRRSMHMFKNKTLIVSVVVREPFVIYNSPAKIKNIQKAIADPENYSGVAIEVMKRLQSIFKFNITIIRPKDNQFGVLVNKVWTGMVGSLFRNESDVGVTALSITFNRAKAIDFTRAYYFETAAVLLKTPEEVQNYLAIFEPFSPAVWFVLLITIMLLIFLVLLMTRLENQQKEQEKFHELMKFLHHGPEMSISSDEVGTHEVKFERRFSTTLNCKLKAVQETSHEHEYGINLRDQFYYAVTCVLNILLIRDIKHPPTQTPIRILVCVWWLSTIIIVNIYLGILFGQLVVPRRPKTIETLEELVNQNKIEWAVTRGSAIYELFRQSDSESIYGRLGLSMHNVSSADEGVRQVLESNWAFIRERSMLTFKAAREHNRLKACKMQFAKEEFFSAGLAIGLRKNSPYLKPFDAALTVMIENGFVSRWESMYWPTKNEFTECKLQPLQEGEPLSIKHFMSIYLVCSFIVEISAIILIYQWFHDRLFKVNK